MRFWPKSPETRTLLIVSAIALVVTLLTLETTPLEIRIGELSVDQWCADAFYGPGPGEWAIDKENAALRFLLYNGPKILIIIMSVLLGIALLLPEKLRAKVPGLNRVPGVRRNAFYLLLCFALIPIICNQTKAVSNIYCPYEHTRYEGHAPYVRLFDEYPEEFKAVQAANPRERGRGFPAGHASGGFALMAIAFVLPRRYFVWGILGGSFVGWSMGMYQQMRGAHYLSHTLVTWFVACIIISVLAALIRPGQEPRAQAEA